MKYTNKLNLPDSIVKSCIEKNEPNIYRISVTELLKPVKELKLYRKHFNEIEVDVSDCINTLFGSAVHKILEDNTDEPDVEKEVKMEYSIDYITLVGKFDRRNLKEQLIEDYKTGKVNTVIDEDFKEYRKQGLIYSWMTFKITGCIIRKLKFYILLKDWSKLKAETTSNYPQSPIYVWEYDVSDSDYDYIEKFIYEKLNLIKSDIIINCTEEERWYTGTTYAVYRNVNDKKATYLTGSETDAHNYITNKCDGAGEIRVRKGEYIKCKYYCNCNKFCDQYLKEENDVS